LFTGPSVFNDGIAGYPEPIYDKTNNSSYVLDHKNSKNIKCLSTNCVYYGAYISLIEMGQLLNADNTLIQSYQKNAEKLKGNILNYFYSKGDNKLNYLIDGDGNIDKSQEGLGISFAVIFKVLNKDQAFKLIQNARISKYGITSIYPDFPRYSQNKPGRHNNLIWPMVNGFFARASIISGNQSAFVKELNGLTQLALDQDKGDYNFREIYNPNTGAPDGGWQNEIHWNSCRLQTWSATAYINMILFGLAGIRVQNDGIEFSPYLPENTHYLELKDFNYQQSILNIIIKGNGSKIKTFLVNGKRQENYRINSEIKGANEIKIELE
jgi:glycogen debranching enzyme